MIGMGRGGGGGHGGGGHHGGGGGWHGHFPSGHGRRLGWGAGWGGWGGDWWPYCYGCTYSEAEACTWSPYAGKDPTVLAAAARLKLSAGEIIFARFPGVPGLYQFSGSPVQIAYCSTGTTVGLGQNYLWDRYPGEIVPDEPAHTGSIGLSGCACASATPVGMGWHNPACQYPSCACYCDLLSWKPAVHTETCCALRASGNPGSPHMPVGVGPVTPSDTVAGLGQGVFPPASTTNPDGTVTIGDVTYTPPTSGPSTPGWPGNGAAVPSASPILTPPTAADQPMPAAASSGTASTSTGLLLGGLLAIGLGLGGIAYLAHARTAGT